MPVEAFAWSVMQRWVSPAGCWMSVSVEPRLTAETMILTASSTRRAASKPPATSNARTLPGPAICRPRRPFGSAPGSPG